MDSYKIGNLKNAIEAIKKYKNIIIFHHTRPDGDCLGCQAGLAELIRVNYPKKKVYTIGNNYNSFDFMNYHYDEISDIDFEDSLGVICDASSSDRIEHGELFIQNKFTATLRIDHHPNGSDIKYDYLWVDPHYAASAEQIAHIAKEAKWKITPKAAAHIFLGIVTDSGNFTFSDTSARTHKLVAYLYEKGKLNANKIFKELNKRTSNDIKFVGEILSNYKQDGKVLYYIVTKEIMKKHNMDSFKAAIFVNQLGNIDDNSCWALFIELEDGKIRGRLRSNGPLVNEVARKYGGGGHDNAAGITLENKKQIKDVLKDLNKIAKEWKE